MTLPAMVDLGTALWLGMIGACIGSFLNVVAYRLPRRMSIVWKPSHCPSCSHPIRARDNVPVLGWILLKGRCRDCGAAISPRYAIVEAAMGLAFFLLAYAVLLDSATGLFAEVFAAEPDPFYNFWDAAWPTISWYVYQTLLVSLLTCVVLFDRDGEAAPLRFVVFAAVAAIASTIVLIDQFSELPSPRPDGAAPNYFAALGGACAGLFVGAALSVAIRGKPVTTHRGKPSTERRGSLFRRPENAIVSCVLMGLFLGGGEVLIIAVVTTLLALTLAMVFRIERHQLMMPLLWLATLLHLIFWQQILDYSPW